MFTVVDFVDMEKDKNMLEELKKQVYEENIWNCRAEA